jgi:hypothetical protein
MAVRTQAIDSKNMDQRDVHRLFELLRAISADLAEIKERLERMEKPINSGKDT